MDGAGDHFVVRVPNVNLNDSPLLPFGGNLKQRHLLICCTLFSFGLIGIWTYAAPRPQKLQYKRTTTNSPSTTTQCSCHVPLQTNDGADATNLRNNASRLKILPSININNSVQEPWLQHQNNGDSRPTVQPMLDDTNATHTLAIFMVNSSKAVMIANLFKNIVVNNIWSQNNDNNNGEIEMNITANSSRSSVDGVNKTQLIVSAENATRLKVISVGDESETTLIKPYQIEQQNNLTRKTPTSLVHQHSLLSPLKRKHWTHSQSKIAPILGAVKLFDRNESSSNYVDANTSSVHNVGVMHQLLPDTRLNKIRQLWSGDEATDQIDQISRPVPLDLMAIFATVDNIVREKSNKTAVLL